MFAQPFMRIAFLAGTPIAVACGLLDRQLDSLAGTFQREGGFTERLYRTRARERQSAS